MEMAVPYTNRSFRNMHKSEESDRMSACKGACGSGYRAP